jgi:DUF4097 and DUF4098 domain-containing protein YvlB
MYRIIYALTATTLTATGAFSVAQAKQIIPMHAQDISKTVTGDYRSVAVSGDYATIKLRTGRSSTVHAHEEWNFNQPKLDVTIDRGVLHVTISCNDDVTVGNGVTVAGALDQANDCIDDLTITLPATKPVQADTSSGNISAAGARGGLKLSTDSGDVTVRDAAGPRIDAASGNGNVTATSTRSHSLTLKSGNGAVTARRITTTVLTAGSDSGDVALTDAIVVAQADAHSGNGALNLTRVHAGSV